MKEKLAREQEKVEQLQKQLEQTKANMFILTGAIQAKLETIALLQEGLDEIKEESKTQEKETKNK